MKSQKSSALSSLPDDIIFQILEFGIQTSALTSRDLCSLSFSCKHFHKLCNDDTLWSTLLALDFPRNARKRLSSAASRPPSSSSSIKLLYKRVLLKHVRLRSDYNRGVLAEYEERAGVLGRKMKRLQREVKVLVQQTKENSGELLRMIRDNYIRCLRRLVGVKRKHMRTEINVSCMRRIVASDDDFLLAFDIRKHKKTVGDDVETGSSEDVESSSEVESEEDGLEVLEDSVDFSDDSDDGFEFLL